MAEWLRMWGRSAMWRLFGFAPSLSSRFTLRLCTFGIVAIVAAGSGTAAAETETPARIPPFFAEYAVTLGRLTLGHSTLELTYPETDRFRYEMFVSPSGLARMILGTDYTDITEGRITEAGKLEPERFRHEREGRDERVEEIVFDREAGVVRFDGEEELEWSPEYVDRLLPQLLIMRDLSGRIGETLRYAIADGGEVSDYTFRAMGRERVSVDAGRFRAERIKRVRDNGDRESNAWVDPEQYNLPVKIEHVAGGRTFIMELKSVRFGE